MTPPPSRPVTAVIAVIAAGSVPVGVWAIIAPHAFYTAIAPFPPYNLHLIHDIGAFQLGLGACLALGLAVGDALLAVLIGNAVGADTHAVSHLLDRHIGGHPSDPIPIGALGLLLTLLTIARAHQITRAPAATTSNADQR